MRGGQLDDAYERLITFFPKTEVRYCTKTKAFYIKGRKLKATPEQILNDHWWTDHLCRGFEYED